MPVLISEVALMVVALSLDCEHERLETSLKGHGVVLKTGCLNLTNLIVCFASKNAPNLASREYLDHVLRHIKFKAKPVAIVGPMMQCHASGDNFLKRQAC